MLLFPLQEQGHVLHSRPNRWVVIARVVTISGALKKKNFRRVSFEESARGKYGSKGWEYKEQKNGQCVLELFL